MLSTEDRQQIAETIALHAYVVDEDRLDRLEELFTPDAVYDMTASGLGAFEGLETIRAAAGRMAASGHAPQAHFVTNTLIAEAEEGAATATSRGLMIMHDGALHTVLYRDSLRLHEGRWLLSRRVITPATRAAGQR